jgi:hypothetical protein
VMDRAGYAARVLGANETLHPDKTP